MGKLLIVSNRLPVSVTKKGTAISFKTSAGGLATGLGSLFHGRYEGNWIGWPGIASDRTTASEKAEINRELEQEHFIPVYLSQNDLDDYYSGFSNRTIWPLFHYFTQYAVYNTSSWNTYIKVNRIFCEAVLRKAHPGDSVWVHDYHLMLLPGMLREKMPGLTIGFFLHIPFPSYEVFRLLPWRTEILDGLLGADLIGFHVFDYARHFLSSLRNRFGIEHSLGHVHTGTRMVKADVFPMGIDYKRFAEASKQPEVHYNINRYQKKFGRVKIILSVDRLDYTKGIPDRLHCYDAFLEKYPEYREKVVLMLVAVPSRTRVEHYRQLKKEVDELVGDCNGRHGTIGWTPVRYIYNSLDFNELNALYSISDVCLITPVRDGMNLIAKEFIAAKAGGNGVLILSEMAGAAKELSEALIVNPNDMEMVVDSIHDALTMPPEEQIERNRTMQARLKRYDVHKWADDFMKHLQEMKQFEQELLSRTLTVRMKQTIIRKYRSAKRRLILLDYDGTLKDFERRPEDAVPDREILRLLITLSGDDSNDICIISGRDRESLGTWFKHFNLGLIAEHGVWVREKDGEWELSEPQVNYWKDQIRHVLERYCDRTPGAIIEEKDYSLAWHYRRTEPELGSMRALELKEEILHFTANLGIGVLEGNKVIEVKNAGINKGSAALKWIFREQYDFILAAGDDRTDEDMFQVLPDSAWSIKVGVPPTNARFSVGSVAEFRSLLNDLSGAEKKTKASV